MRPWGKTLPIPPLTMGLHGFSVSRRMLESPGDDFLERSRVQSHGMEWMRREYARFRKLRKRAQVRHQASSDA